LYQKIQCIQSRRNEKKTSSEEFPRLVSDDDNNNGEASGVGKRGNLKRFKKKVDDILNKIADISACYVGLLLVFIFCTYCIITRAPAVGDPLEVRTKGLELFSCVPSYLNSDSFVF
jgi:hypothetical protein